MSRSPHQAARRNSLHHRTVLGRKGSLRRAEAAPLRLRAVLSGWFRDGRLRRDELKEPFSTTEYPKANPPRDRLHGFAHTPSSTFESAIRSQRDRLSAPGKHSSTPAVLLGLGAAVASVQTPCYDSLLTLRVPESPRQSRLLFQPSLMQPAPRCTPLGSSALGSGRRSPSCPVSEEWICPELRTIGSEDRRHARLGRRLCHR